MDRVSSSSSASSSPAPFLLSDHGLHNQSHQKVCAKNIEEVWKDINIASLHDHPSDGRDLFVPMTPRVATHHNPNCTFQDFLNGSVKKDPPGGLSLACSLADGRDLCGSRAPQPATALNLNSGQGFEFLDCSNPLVRPNSHLQNRISSNISPFDATFEGLAPSPPLGCFGGKKSHESADNSSTNRRHKRMIKNRESAARSRARKQAYTNELELEVAHLMKENARLKRQQEQLCLAAASQLPKKHTLQRTSTAPF